MYAVVPPPVVNRKTPEGYAIDSRDATVRDFWSLLKPGVMTLVVYTGAIGALLAPGTMHPFFICLIILSIAIGSGSAAAFNMWYDRDIDQIMRRTQKRAIPAGRIAPADGLGYAVILGVFSVMLMGLVSNAWAAGLLTFSIFFYSIIYTIFLKRSTAQNIVIGGVAGAFPPLIGWLAVTPTLDPLPLYLFLMIFLWTPSHFWALALHRHQDYQMAQIPMLPITAGIETTKKHILMYSAALVAVSLLPITAYRFSAFYVYVSLFLGFIYMLLAFRVHRDHTSANALRLFFYSILYLFLIFTALLVDHQMAS